jgi:hypothetical protein
VQGKLRKKLISFVIKTRCANSGQPMQIEIDSELKIKSVEQGANPLIFVPKVNFFTLKDPSIIEAF